MINYTYDTYNCSDVVAESGGESFVLGWDYADHGGVEEIQFGNLLRQKYCYNNRLQMTGTELSPYGTPYGVAVDCVQIASNLITLNFDYGSASQNNGNIVGQTIGASADDVWQQYYTYDGTNRLAMASENAAITGSSCPGGATWCQKYGYDHFGNRWISSSLDTLHMATPTAQSGVSLATNRLTSGTYDAAGNLTAQTHITTGGGSMAYDANNKVTSFTATGVSVATKYDAAGRRVRKIYNSQTTIWVYDAFGKLAAEYTTATQTTPVGTYYRTTDQLGSTRLVTDESGRVRQRLDFFPFGEQIPASASFGNRNDVSDGGFATYNASLSMRQQFTGQQRDEETGLDYFLARNMAAPLARFLSMDPGNAGAMPSNPQSWNAFAYVNGNPLRFVDPDGRNCDVVNANDVCTIWVADTNGVDWAQYVYGGFDEYCRYWGCDPGDRAGSYCDNGGTFDGFICIQPEAEPEPEPETTTAEKVACGIDAFVKGAVSIFVPGVGTALGLGEAAGYEVTIAQGFAGTMGWTDGTYITEGENILSATGLVGGGADATQLGFGLAYRDAGGETALNKAIDITTQTGFGRSSPGRQNRWLGRRDSLFALRRGVRLAATVGNVLAAGETVWGVADCVAQ